MAAPTSNPTTATAATNAAPPAGQTPNCPCPDLVTIPIVDIDKDGIFKYVVFRLRDPKYHSGEPPVVIVRGYKRHSDFTDLIDEVKEQQQPLICEPFTGGYINNDSVNKTIHIFGSALGIDKDTPDRQYVAILIQKKYPGYRVTTGEKDIAPLPKPAP